MRCRRLVRSEGGWWWFLTRRQWKVLMRTLRGNTADVEEEVWCWNARQLSAGLVDAVGSRSGIKWRWLGETLCEHTPDVVCLLEVEGSIRDIRRLGARFFGQLGYSFEFSVGQCTRKSDGRPVFGNCIIIAVRREYARLVAKHRRAIRCFEVVAQPHGSKSMRRFVAVHGLHRKAEQGEDT